MSESTTEQSSREREAFEAWIRKDGGDLSTFGSGKHVHYNNTGVECAWEAWLARSALSGSAESGEAWQPIATAPTDGSPVILGYMPNDDYPTGFVGQGRWAESDDDGPDNMGHDAGFVDDCYTFFHCGRSFGNPKYQGPGLQPTHWQPLPTVTPSALPAQAVGEKATDAEEIGFLLHHIRKASEELSCCNYNSAAERLKMALDFSGLLAAPVPQPEPTSKGEA